MKFGMVLTGDPSLQEQVDLGKLGERVGFDKLYCWDSHILKQGDVISFQCSGSGGFGPPGERSAAIVREDVLDEYVSKEIAQEIYGFSASLGTEPT